jgi:flotillin
VDRAVNNSGVLTDLKESLIGSDEQTTAKQIRRFVSQFGLKSEDIKNLTISALVAKLIAKSDKENKGVLNNLLSTVKDLGMANKPVKELGL